jgi:AraC-like DNA-binding protein
VLDELGRLRSLPFRVPLPRDARLSQLCEALLADPASDLTLEQWAAKVGASSRTLARLFREELDMGFSDWRQQMRLAQAVPLFSRGWSIARIAAELGYSSQSAFAAMFKRTFGVAPRRFLKAG